MKLSKRNCDKVIFEMFEARDALKEVFPDVEITDIALEGGDVTPHMTVCNVACLAFRTSRAKMLDYDVTLEPDGKYLHSVMYGNVRVYALCNAPYRAMTQEAANMVHDVCKDCGNPSMNCNACPVAAYMDRRVVI